MRVSQLIVPTALAALASAQYYETYFEGDLAAREAFPEYYDELDLLQARDFKDLEAREFDDIEARDAEAEAEPEAEAEAEPIFYDDESIANALIARDPEAFDALVEIYARDALALAEADPEADALADPDAEAEAEKEKKKKHKSKVSRP